MKCDPSETPSRSPAGVRGVMSQTSRQLKSPLAPSPETIPQHFLLCSFTAAAPATQDLGSKAVLDLIITLPFHSLPFSPPWLSPVTHSQFSNIQERKKIITKYYLRGKGAIPVPHAMVKPILHTTAPTTACLLPGGPAASRRTPCRALGPGRSQASPSARAGRGVGHPGAQGHPSPGCPLSDNHTALSKSKHICTSGPS